MEFWWGEAPERPECANEDRMAFRRFLVSDANSHAEPGVGRDQGPSGKINRDSKRRNHTVMAHPRAAARRVASASPTK